MSLRGDMTSRGWERREARGGTGAVVQPCRAAAAVTLGKCQHSAGVFPGTINSYTDRRLHSEPTLGHHLQTMEIQGTLWRNEAEQSSDNIVMLGAKAFPHCFSL